ncbi:bromodomain associated protein [Ascosphaera apis ARSEF 7405]|uniref:Bromodomain associated protein n=1 Tax=Ascosphaera apis ARSEF 7405 TaxID=392613 RepID=A0A162II02_9EURO|nr:bromodomain associated protein [Ascosphaera apis ARSEF 7405]
MPSTIPPSPSLYHSLLRPPILQILRAAGFQAARPTVIDTLTDLAARYLLLLAESTASHIDLSHPEVPAPNLVDVLYALREAGSLRPQLSDCEEWSRGEEDTRGVDALVGWMMGENVGGGVGEVGMGKEIRRVAGFVAAERKEVDVDVDVLEKEDYLTSLKKKHSKTGEESRYQGTAIGKDAEAHRITVEGAAEGGPRSIKQWVRQTRKRTREEDAKAAKKRAEREAKERKERERLEEAERVRKEREEEENGSSGLSSLRSSVEVEEEGEGEEEDDSSSAGDIGIKRRKRDDDDENENENEDEGSEMDVDG